MATFTGAVAIHYLKPDTAIHTIGPFLPAFGIYVVT